MSFIFACALLAPQAVDQKAIDGAVARGVEWLKMAGSPAFAKPDDGWHVPDSDELILWTFVHAGVPESDPRFQALFKKMVAAPLGRTYKAALQAMILEEVDRRTWQKQIAYCAQFLLDNHCQNGQWGYGDPVAMPVPPVPSGGFSVRSGGGKDDGPRVKPPVSRRLNMRQLRTGPASGDNSNSQYAALGLRACEEAGLNLPKNVLVLARNWWATTLVRDGGPAGGTASGPGAPPHGWGYRVNSLPDPYGSMTAGGVGAVAIYDHLLDRDWRKDPVVQGGLAWLTMNYSVTENPGHTVHFGDRGKTAALFYYLYALERACVLTEVPLLGNKDWYLDGARLLLSSQKPEGRWDTSGTGENDVWQTCFAILFLKKATRPLTASVDR